MRTITPEISPHRNITSKTLDSIIGNTKHCTYMKSENTGTEKCGAVYHYTLFLKISLCLLGLFLAIFIFFSGGGREEGGGECACGDVRKVVVVEGE